MRKALLLLCTLSLAGALPLAAQTSAGAPQGAVYSKPPAKIEVNALPATVVEDVIVPVPSEVFTVLDKLGEPNWHQLVRDNSDTHRAQRYQISLLLGTTIANGFIAVQAQDQEAVKRVGEDVLSLADAIAVKQSVLPHCKTIIESADANDWNRVREELDKAQQNVRQAMIELKDEQLAQLISLGGWLRGTEAVTTVVEREFSPQSAELLHQPDLLRYFQQRLAAMPSSLRENKLVPRIEEQLNELSPLIADGASGGPGISLDSVKRIHAVTGELVAAIEKPEGT